jgi:hypothetical protein
VTQDQAEALAAGIKALYRETSAATGKGISEVFEDACEAYMRANPAAVGPARTNEIGVPAQPKEKRECC